MELQSVSQVPASSLEAFRSLLSSLLEAPGVCSLLAIPADLRAEQAATFLSEWIKDYLSDCYGLSPRTRTLYATHLEYFLKSVGDKPIGEVRAAVVRGFLSGLRRKNGQPYSEAYLDQVYRTLNTFFQWLVREGVLVVNPMTQVRRPKVPKRKSPRLKLEEIERLVEAVRGTCLPARNLAILYLMLDSGLRRGEVLELREENLDFKNGVVIAFGKDKEEREVPLGEDTIAALRDYLAARPSSTSPALFLARCGKPLTNGGLGTMMHRFKTAAGLPQLCCHLLRHTFANHYIAGGGSLRKLQKALGHSSVQTTAKFYTDPEFSELRSEHARVSPLAQLRERKSG